MPETALLILILCAAGLGVSGIAWRGRNAALAADPAVRRDSVFGTPHAAIGPIPNAALGVVFYAAVAAVTLWFPALKPLALVAAGAAVAYGVYLVYVLRRVLRTHCRVCYTGHAVNAALFVALLL